MAVFAHFRGDHLIAAGGGEDADDDGSGMDSKSLEPTRNTFAPALEAEEEAAAAEQAASGKQSRRKLRQTARLSVAELKNLVARPDLVEPWDVTARDPHMLLVLKAARNAVPVPQHWLQKRKYLQNKRGVLKLPFELPDFVRRTGILELRESLGEKEAQKSMKQKMREKIRPKMGKMEIDYQKLHDAFFRYQTKPKNMTGHGDLYHEGKENEVKLHHFIPGELSDELKEALGMKNDHGVVMPPPWLIAMQRYGPPPSYPRLKIPGLNAPLPQGASFGFHPGGWGKPPVDAYGRPLYGDVFGVLDATRGADDDDAGMVRQRWGGSG